MRTVYFSSTVRPLPQCTLFPYTTLFRSKLAHLHGGAGRKRLPEIAHAHVLVLEIFVHVGHVGRGLHDVGERRAGRLDRKSTRLNSSHRCTSYAVFCLKTKLN